MGALAPADLIVTNAKVTTLDGSVPRRRRSRFETVGL